MLRTDAIRHVKTQRAIAQALDISEAAISKWGEVVPLDKAMALEILTKRKLRVDKSRYEDVARAIDVAGRAAL
jgi:hypothetical protein